MKNAARTINDVKVGDTVRYVKAKPKETWMCTAWGDHDDLIIGREYIVSRTGKCADSLDGNWLVVKDMKIDTRCFELVQ